MCQKSFAIRNKFATYCSYLPITTVLCDQSCYLHEIDEETELWLVNLGKEPQIQVSKFSAIFFCFPNTKVS